MYFRKTLRIWAWGGAPRTCVPFSPKVHSRFKSRTACCIRAGSGQDWPRSCARARVGCGQQGPCTEPHRRRCPADQCGKAHDVCSMIPLAYMRILPESVDCFIHAVPLDHAQMRRKINDWCAARSLHALEAKLASSLESCTREHDLVCKGC